MKNAEPLMTREQRAAQIWSVLAFTAMNRQILTYGLLAKLIGVPTSALGQLLEPVQAYCLVHGLPPLTALVVSDETGLPGSGFLPAGSLPAAQMAVFRHAWTSRQPPKPAEFAEAAQQTT